MVPPLDYSPSDEEIQTAVQSIQEVPSVIDPEELQRYLNFIYISDGADKRVECNYCDTDTFGSWDEGLDGVAPSCSSTSRSITSRT